MFFPLCSYCEHYRENNVCAAYPDGIPNGVLWNRLGHFWPMKGDHGIQFNAKPVLTREEIRDITSWRKKYISYDELLKRQAFVASSVDPTRQDYEWFTNDSGIR